MENSETPKVWLKPNNLQSKDITSVAETYLTRADVTGWLGTNLQPNHEYAVTVRIVKDSVTLELVDLENRTVRSCVTVSAYIPDRAPVIKFKTPDTGLLVHVANEENYRARIFEDAVASFLEREYKYQTRVRCKLEYLQGKEIDVFAEKGVMPKDITVAECKLQENNTPITMSEVQDFTDKIRHIRENEGKRGQVRFYFWFVTNTDKFEEGIKKYVKNQGIELMRAKLPSNWKNRADWSIAKISAICG